MNDEIHDLSEINVTPLVDVMLVLLVIFIVTVPVLRMSVPVDLPQLTANPIVENPLRLEVALKEDGSYWLDGNRVDPPMLSQRLKVASGNPEAAVEINADQKCQYGEVVELLGLVRDAGIQKVGFATRR